MKTDDSTTVAEIKSAISQFAAERDWEPYHDPKNLVMAIASEVGELTEHFRWVPSGESLSTAMAPQNAEAVAHELADVLMFAFEFATVCHIDIASAIASKLEINRGRYPIDKAKGTSKKYDQL